MTWTTLRVPASSANLGPGFDALALALQIYLECRFRASPKLSIRVSGCDAASIAATEENLIWRTARSVGPVPPVELEIINHIPLGKGLGSSAAALVAGIAMADRLLGLNWSQHDILDCAAGHEGHPDNVAASVFGGVTASALDADGRVHTVRLELPERCRIALVLPNYALPTHKSRAVLPESYSRRDVTFNVQRCALLVAALAAGDLSALSAALEDRLHQPYRAPLVAGLTEALAHRMPGLIGCALSGAGPAVLVFYKEDAPAVPESLCRLLSSSENPAVVLPVSVDTKGLQRIGPGSDHPVRVDRSARNM
jgi:homoserine kinase